MSCFPGSVRAGLASLAIATWGPAVASADDGEAALYLPEGLEAADEQALRAALTAELEVRLVDLGDARRRLARDAERLGDDPTEGHVEALEREALEAYLHLRFDDALRAYERAVDAMLAADRRPADPARLARLVFGRALVRLAAHRTADAQADLGLALDLDPSFAPDRAEYGPPVFRALAQARGSRGRRRAVDVRIDRAPESATVRVDGREVAAGEPIELAAGSRHLLTVDHPGYVPNTRMLEVPAARGPAPRVAVVLEPAEGPLLAWQALALWGDGPAPAPPAAPLVARSLSASHVVEARAAGGGEIALTLRDATSGEVVRSTTATRVEWEPAPYRVAAAALAGRMLTPPAPSDVALMVSAPSRVAPESAIPIRVGLRDAAGRVHRILARCGSARAGVELGEASSAVTLSLDAPDRETTLHCLVTAVDGSGRVLARAPDEGGELLVEVAELDGERPWYGLWYVWGVIGAALAAGVTTAIVVTRNDDPQQLLRVHGP